MVGEVVRSMFRKSSRNEPRFETRNPETVRVTIGEVGTDGGVAAQGKLSDISRGGAKLIVSQRLPMQASVCMRLENPELQLDLTITGEVCWIVPAEGEGFAIGCTFVPDLPTDILEKLFACGLLERRIFSRRALRVPAKARWEMEPNPTDAFLWDLSEGGFCVLSPQPRTPGKRVLVTVTSGDKEAYIPAKTQWGMKVGEGYVVGCEFVSKDGYLMLRDLENTAQHAPRIESKERRSTIRHTFRSLVDSFLKTPAAAK